jgi:putative Mg2+ transporter-C (MgtC) family protein
METFEYESLIKLALAIVLGAVVGLEREIHGRPAGMRTQALVCLSSALLVLVSRQGALAGFGGVAHVTVNIDPSRMAAGIVTGIGFLGAGAILRVRDSLIRGLTTAASIWFVAAVGIAIGLGEYVLGLVSTGCGFLILNVVARFEEGLGKITYRTLEVEVKSAIRPEIEQICRELFEKREIKIVQVDYAIDNRIDSARISFSVRIAAKAVDPELISQIAELKDVWQVKWI